MAEIELDSCLHVGSGYRRGLKKFQKAYKKELISPEEYYFEWEIGSLDSLIVKESLNKEQVGLLIDTLDWESIMDKIKNADEKQYRKMKYSYDNYIRYDKHIYFVKSPITEARIKP